MGGQAVGSRTRSRGWKAACFLAALATGIIYSAFHTRDAAADEVAEPLRRQLLAEYTQPSAHEVHGWHGREAAGHGAEPTPTVDDIRFRCITARGLFRTLWVRVEIEVSGHDPPDGRPVRYFRLHHSEALGQWFLDGETTALAYHLPF